MRLAGRLSVKNRLLGAKSIGLNARLAFLPVLLLLAGAAQAAQNAGAFPARVDGRVELQGPPLPFAALRVTLYRAGSRLDGSLIGNADCPPGRVRTIRFRRRRPGHLCASSGWVGLFAFAVGRDWAGTRRARVGRSSWAANSRHARSSHTATGDLRAGFCSRRKAGTRSSFDGLEDGGRD